MNFKQLIVPLTIILFVALLHSVATAKSGGDKVRSKSPVFVEECVIQAPGIDLDNCVEQPAPPQSGIQVFFCNTDTVVTCVQEE